MSDHSKPEAFHLKTADGVTISALHYRGASQSPSVLLVHMLPAVKEWWDTFAQQLHAAGFGVLAIDLRGHGESENGPGGYRLFSSEETKKSIQDLHAGISYQKQEGHHPRFVIGASIGANLSLQLLAEDAGVRAAVLLSPGIDYHGIKTIPYAEMLRDTQSLFIAAAKDDERRAGNAASMAEEIVTHVATGSVEKKIYDNGGHGTDLLLTHPKLSDEIISWLSRGVN